ncbi:MAG: malonyl CoA-acyl carrier protein transacylase [Herpetosiphonaceae bacterium]|nr:MAG: malonyl CoA-acyl carrier protein transacylase [Herpetosiphonaceae bacterium]
MTVAFVFPGQGSQIVGMGRDIYEQSKAARLFFNSADDILGFPLSRLCFEGPADELTHTENAQPALLTVSSALLAALCERAGLSWTPDALVPHPLPLAPQAAAGHSLGEYSALVAAGALDFPTALRLVRRRGELMSQSGEGTMAAIIGLDLEPLLRMCDEASELGPVVVANQNSPGQLVISGAAAAVERVMALARERGAKRTISLKVSAAFHSPLMERAANELRKAIATAIIHQPRIPVISNVTAGPLSIPEVIREELVQQVTAPVRWISTVEMLVGTGVDCFVEIGPGAVLTGLIKRITPGLRLVNIATAEHLAAVL